MTNAELAAADSERVAERIIDVATPSSDGDADGDDAYAVAELMLAQAERAAQMRIAEPEAATPVRKPRAPTAATGEQQPLFVKEVVTARTKQPHRSMLSDCLEGDDLVVSDVASAMKAGRPWEGGIAGALAAGDAALPSPASDGDSTTTPSRAPGAPLRLGDGGPGGSTVAAAEGRVWQSTQMLAGATVQDVIRGVVRLCNMRGGAYGLLAPLSAALAHQQRRRLAGSTGPVMPAHPVEPASHGGTHTAAARAAPVVMPSDESPPLEAGIGDDAPPEEDAIASAAPPPTATSFISPPPQQPMGVAGGRAVLVTRDGMVVPAGPQSPPLLAVSGAAASAAVPGSLDLGESVAAALAAKLALLPVAQPAMFELRVLDPGDTDVELDLPPLERSAAVEATGETLFALCLTDAAAGPLPRAWHSAGLFSTVAEAAAAARRVVLEVSVERSKSSRGAAVLKLSFRRPRWRREESGRGDSAGGLTSASSGGETRDRRRGAGVGGTREAERRGPPRVSAAAARQPAMPQQTSAADDSSSSSDEDSGPGGSTARRPVGGGVASQAAAAADEDVSFADWYAKEYGHKPGQGDESSGSAAVQPAATALTAAAAARPAAVTAAPPPPPPTASEKPPAGAVSHATPAKAASRILGAIPFRLPFSSAAGTHARGAPAPAAVPAAAAVPFPVHAAPPVIPAPSRGAEETSYDADVEAPRPRRGSGGVAAPHPTPSHVPAAATSTPARIRQFLGRAFRRVDRDAEPQTAPPADAPSLPHHGGAATATVADADGSPGAPLPVATAGHDSPRFPQLTPTSSAGARRASSASGHPAGAPTVHAGDGSDSPGAAMPMAQAATLAASQGAGSGTAGGGWASRLRLGGLFGAS